VTARLAAAEAEVAGLKAALGRDPCFPRRVADAGAKPRPCPADRHAASPEIAGARITPSRERPDRDRQPPLVVAVAAGGVMKVTLADDVL
jgi:hypothetical protein